jgi:hypothetical protein
MVGFSASNGILELRLETIQLHITGVTTGDNALLARGDEVWLTSVEASTRVINEIERPLR